MSKNIKKENIWVFHHYATPPTMNGFTRPYDLGGELNKKGYKVTIFSASYLHFSNINLINNRQLYTLNNDSKIPFIFIKTTSSANNGVKRILNMMQYYKNLIKTAKMFIKKNLRPDIIIASSPHPLAMLAGIKIAKKLKIPCICEVRDFWPEVFFMGGKLKEKSLIGKLLINGEHWIYKNADAIIFLKPGDTNYLWEKKWTTSQGGDIELEKCFYINNGVNIKLFDHQIESNILKDADLLNEKFKVVYTGAIRPVNNVGNIIDAAKLLKRNEDIQFLIYGQGNQLNHLKQRVKDEGITNVVIKGYVDKKFIPYILSKSSLNILNYSQSKYNWSRGNSSNKLFEYMASGNPIISTVKMGYSPLEEYECGVSLDEASPEKLAKAIMEFYSMPLEEFENFGLKAREGVGNFDYETLSNKLVEVINFVNTGIRGSVK
jgi:glycosyltransferase involved in cell wall biosynthesis